MSRLDSLSGASFRPAQSQTATGAGEKVASKVQDSVKGEQGHFHTDGFDCRPPRDPSVVACAHKLPGPLQPRDPGTFACAHKLPNPLQPHDPGIFACAQKVPSPLQPHDPGI